MCQTSMPASPGRSGATGGLLLMMMDRLPVVSGCCACSKGAVRRITSGLKAGLQPVPLQAYLKGSCAAVRMHCASIKNSGPATWLKRMESCASTPIFQERTGSGARTWSGVDYDRTPYVLQRSCSCPTHGKCKRGNGKPRWADDPFSRVINQGASKAPGHRTGFRHARVRTLSCETRWGISRGRSLVEERTTSTYLRPDCRETDQLVLLNAEFGRLKPEQLQQSLALRREKGRHINWRVPDSRHAIGARN